MKHALVTGGAGFIGSHLVDALLERGWRVDVLDDFSTGRRENVQLRDNLTIMHQKIEDSAYDIPTMPAYTHVFHLAARARIQPSIENPLGTDRANVHGTLVALEIARHCKAHFIFSSSSSVYSGRELPLKYDGMRNVHPRNPYALSKLIGEQYCALYSELYGLKTTALRYFNVFGERQQDDGPYNSVVGIFLRQKRAGETLTVVGDGEQRRDFTYVQDVVAANILVAEKGLVEVYNVGRGSNCSVNEIAKAVGGETTNVPERKGEARETLADTEPLRAEGWTPTMDVIDWIKTQL